MHPFAVVALVIVGMVRAHPAMMPAGRSGVDWPLVPYSLGKCTSSRLDVGAAAATAGAAPSRSLTS